MNWLQEARARCDEWMPCQDPDCNLANYDRENCLDWIKRAVPYLKDYSITGEWFEEGEYESLLQLIEEANDD